MAHVNPAHTVQHDIRAERNAQDRVGNRRVGKSRCGPHIIGHGPCGRRVERHLASGFAHGALLSNLDLTD